MPDLVEDATISHVEKMKRENTNHLVRHNPDIKGEVDIEVRSNGRYNVTVYKGTDQKPTNIEDISKDKLMDMLAEQL